VCGCSYGYSGVLGLESPFEGTVPNLYSGSAWFESRPGNLLSGQVIFVGFLRSSRQMLAWYLNLGDDHLFFHPTIYFSLCRITSRCLAKDFVVTETINVHRQHVQFSFCLTECNSGSLFVISYG